MRQNLDASCDIVFTAEEWKVAYRMTHHKKPPKKPIALSNMLNLIAQFGGYLNRKNDGEPCPTAIWIGLQRLRDFIRAKNVYDDIGS
ncbi:MAG: hypothetical protein KIT27_11260 [Legionellales bacterium]|nr:hypothetical protein [Legionellales bacterium]